MAITLVAAQAAYSPDGISVTIPAIDTTGATLVIAYVVAISAPLTITDSKSNTWVDLPYQNDPFGVLFYAVNPTVGAGHTVTYNPGSASYCSICVAAFAGVTLDEPLDQSVGVQSTGVATVTPGSLTPGADNALVVSAASVNNGAAATISGGFTIAAQHPYGMSTYGSALAYLIQTTAAAADPTWGSVGATAMAGTNAVFLAAALVSSGHWWVRWAARTDAGVSSGHWWVRWAARTDAGIPAAGPGLVSWWLIRMRRRFEDDDA